MKMWWSFTGSTYGAVLPENDRLVTSGQLLDSAQPVIDQTTAVTNSLLVF